MPRGVGVFIRTNGEFEGEQVWQDDLATNIKIIALRHDTHDQDIADGVAECLPKTGNEPMLGALNLGTFKIFNMDDGGDPTDAASRGQIVNQMVFDDQTRTLTLYRTSDTMAPLAVTIPSGGDNTVITTGVQEVVVGSGLSLDSVGGGNVLNEGNDTGEISLSTINGVSGSYVNPNITIDSKGRITAATTGVGAGTVSNLSASYNTVEVTINNSGGTPVTLVKASTSFAGVMSASNFNDLQALLSASSSYASKSGSNTFTGTNTFSGVVNFNEDVNVSSSNFNFGNFANVTFSGTSNSLTLPSATLGASLPSSTVTSGKIYVDASGFLKRQP